MRLKFKPRPRRTSYGSEVAGARDFCNREPMLERQPMTYQRCGGGRRVIRKKIQGV